MKQTILFLILICFAGDVFAQKQVSPSASISGKPDCKTLMNFTKGFKTQMTSYDSKNQVTGVVNQEVLGVSAEGADVVATCQISMDEAKKRSKSDPITTKLRCRNGNVVMNFRDLMGSRTSFAEMKNMEVKISGDEVEIPHQLSVGQSLPECTMSMQVVMNGNPLMTMSSTMKNRVVEKKELVSSSAGSFDCYKITYQIVNSTGMGEEFRYAFWVDKGLTIKTATFDEEGKMLNYTILTKLERP